VLAVTDWAVFVFRLIHITAGVWWAGSIFMFVVFVQPSARAIAPAGAPFMMEFLARRKVPDRLLMLAATTIVAGLVLYWIRWHDYASLGDYATSGMGLGITIGALSAITAALIGLFATRPTANRFMGLAGQVAASGQPPSPEVGQQIQQLQAKLTMLAKLNLTFVTIAVVCMATARYW
jgi:hypothetical protein